MQRTICASSAARRSWRSASEGPATWRIFPARALLQSGEPCPATACAGDCITVCRSAPWRAALAGARACDDGGRPWARGAREDPGNIEASCGHECNDDNGQRRQRQDRAVWIRSRNRTQVHIPTHYLAYSCPDGPQRQHLLPTPFPPSPVGRGACCCQNEARRSATPAAST